ncbi:CRISPR-associated protein [Clostridium acetireducens DSM 10703]|uniref:CRISPR-associated protein n=1 Tax=Clostridium acetireducens DSM 10703 TaxID=1121290 RepID=A0A1E8EXL9_9CLOT|nr:TIGR02556 family CRISPR-associated protein [Clostridium acetireducens]OFI05281.1 CRISPR-associated protein [Clostridium acetireducens DSM 10703]
MQEAIIQIGHKILEKEGFLENLVQKLEPTRKNKQLHVLKFNFSTTNLSLSIDVNEEMDEKTASKYLYVGSAAGAASDQWYVSATNNLYHITETMPNLLKLDLGEELNNKIKFIVENYFVDLSKEFKSNKNRYILNFEILGIKENPKNIFEEIFNEENDKGTKNVYKAIKDTLKKKFLSLFETYIKDEKNLSFNDIGLYTIFIDGKPICDYEQYKEVVLRDKQSVKSLKGNGICSLCSIEKDLTSDIKTDIKFYTTNQLIFASGLEKSNYKHNMLLCQDCLNKLLIGEKYIKNNLNTYLTGFTVYLIPHFIFGENLNKEEMDLVCEKIKKSFNTVKNYKDIEELRYEIENSLDFKNAYENSYFLINFIFYKNVQKATKIQKFIKDVNPSIFESIGQALLKSNKSYVNIFEGDYKRRITLGTAYYLTAIRLKSGEAMEYRNLLTLYERILTKGSIKRESIISNILKVCKIQFFEEASFNVSTGNMKDSIIYGNMYIRFLEELGCLRREVSMLNVEKLLLEDKMKDYIKEMNYGEQETSLFLLGYLVGEVGNSQRKGSLEGKKPILNKLNFGGMDKSKIIRLTGEVFNKLRQEKILKFNEKNFGQCKELLDKNINNWTLSKQENLFYILSGYGYATNKFVLNKKDGGEEDEQ